MTRVANGGVRTTQDVRRAIQQSDESVRALARRFGISPTTVQKWRKRTTTIDAKLGPKTQGAKVLTADEEKIVAKFRRHTLLPLDDCLYALQPAIPTLTRSTLHRCLQRHGISQLPARQWISIADRANAPAAIGSFRASIVEVGPKEEQLHLYVAADVVSKLAFTQLQDKADLASATTYLHALTEAVPYQIHTLVTDHRSMNEVGFDELCRSRGIEHRAIGPFEPWPETQSERLSGGEEVSCEYGPFQSHAHLCAYVDAFMRTYNYDCRLKALRGLTPYEYVARIWAQEPGRFKADAYQYFIEPKSAARRLSCFASVSTT